MDFIFNGLVSSNNLWALRCLNFVWYVICISIYEFLKVWSHSRQVNSLFGHAGECEWFSRVTMAPQSRLQLIFKLLRSFFIFGSGITFVSSNRQTGHFEQVFGIQSEQTRLRHSMHRNGFKVTSKHTVHLQVRVNGAVFFLVIFLTDILFYKLVLVNSIYKH